ncbi:MAG: N-acetylmuramoyl-L-alanine amidase [Proteobacteria bacterium]|nr:N-acetylmuramoyl-L-alanine amidase [Pseudomonadota bacterium]
MRGLAILTALVVLAGCPPADPEPAPVEETSAPATAAPTPEPTPPAPLVRTLRRVVVDAGHGGEDLGAIGVSGVQEKDITLAIARALARELAGRGIEVVQTRPEDAAVALARRAEITNASGAGLFISIHANSAETDRAHGIETYSMDVAADEAAMRLAERENREAEVVGRQANERDLDATLHELRQGVIAEESARFARALHGSLVDSLQGFYGADRISDRFHRTAPFWVLVDSEVPAVLVEVGYLSNAPEERRLRTGGYHHRAALALADAVATWVDEREPAE